MLELLQYEFMRNALLAGIMASIACGVIGAYVVVKRIVFIAGGISHASFGGIGLGYYLGFNPLVGAILFSLASALGIGFLGGKTKREDTSIGILWSVGMALGIIFIGLTPGYAPDLFSYLFGSILSVPFSDLAIMGLLDFLILATVAAFHNQFFALCFDEEYAKAAGVSVEKIYLVLLCLIALTVVLLIRVVGLILVIALLTFPAATANLFTSNLERMMVFSSLLAIFFTIVGLSLSAWLNIASGATIILAASLGFGIASIYKK